MREKPEVALEEAILSRVADGIIVSSAFASARMARLLLKHDFPQICIGEPRFGTILSWIDTNVNIDLFSLGVHAGNLLLKKIRNPAMLVQTYTVLLRLPWGTTRVR